MKRIYFIAALLFLATAGSFSQGTFLGGTYSIGIPSAGIDNYISAASFRGANFEGLKELNTRFAVGWLIGWNVFSETRTDEVYSYDNLTLTGTQYRYMNLFPMLARGIYELGSMEGVRTYLGAGAGVTPDIAKTNVGLYSFQKNGWHFTMAPEAGIIIPLGYGSVTASFRYTYGVRTKEIDNISFFSINLGMLWGE